MPLDAEFICAAQQLLDPYEPSSGTEGAAFLLYGLVKMQRPRTVVEHGSGYSTLFVLRALADNVADTGQERQALLEKTQASRVLEHMPDFSKVQTLDSAAMASIGHWFRQGGRASAAQPAFYATPYAPRLYSFGREAWGDETHDKVQAAVDALRLSEHFSFMKVPELRKAHLPQSALPIDLAWSARDDYREFFTEFWNCLSPYGGLMVLHNVPGQVELYEAVQWMKEQRRTLGDLQLLIVQEPHKLTRNGCAVLRRYSLYRPIFGFSGNRIVEITRDLRTCVEMDAGVVHDGMTDDLSRGRQ